MESSHDSFSPRSPQILNRESQVHLSIPISTSSNNNPLSSLLCLHPLLSAPPPLSLPSCPLLRRRSPHTLLPILLSDTGRWALVLISPDSLLRASSASSAAARTPLHNESSASTCSLGLHSARLGHCGANGSSRHPRQLGFNWARLATVDRGLVEGGLGRCTLQTNAARGPHSSHDTDSRLNVVKPGLGSSPHNSPHEGISQLAAQLRPVRPVRPVLAALASARCRNICNLCATSATSSQLHQREPLVVLRPLLTRPFPLLSAPDLLPCASLPHFLSNKSTARGSRPSSTALSADRLCSSPLLSAAPPLHL
ncbi:hypothetical protein B0T25DRAFT_184586 [Lasiosphaeria hispida]|uniref:Uncharacterized protein n=1 Tax=Lasiosphaeria hispida TaxID=260671 RepID=A0AAJ0MDR6_9PEZI|nr:hypothetical protein B0T25DRAFT_184586 [Lasiosphaeria hispida]